MISFLPYSRDFSWAATTMESEDERYYEFINERYGSIDNQYEQINRCNVSATNGPALGKCIGLYIGTNGNTNGTNSNTNGTMTSDNPSCLETSELIYLKYENEHHQLFVSMLHEFMVNFNFDNDDESNYELLGFDKSHGMRITMMPWMEELFEKRVFNERGFKVMESLLYGLLNYISFGSLRRNENTSCSDIRDYNWFYEMWPQIRTIEQFCDHFVERSMPNEIVGFIWIMRK